MIRLLLGDDHVIFRQGLKRLLADHADFKIVAEAASHAEVVRVVRAQTIDVAILDLSMPGGSGIDLIGAVKACDARVRVLAWNMRGEELQVMQILRAGAVAYLTREAAVEELALAIRRVAAGGGYVCASGAERLTFEFASDRTSEPIHRRLSTREYRIFEMLVEGKRGSEIAQELALSEKTVSTHKARVLKKMNVGNCAELVRYAVKHQLMAL